MTDRVSSIQPSDERHVFLCADSNYVMPLAVTLRSLAESQTAPEVLRITVLSVGISSRDQERVRESVPTLALNFIPIDDLLPSSLPTMRNLNRATYGRLYGVDLLPPHVDRAVYLDADTIACDDLEFLFSFDLDGAPIAAAQDLTAPFISVAPCQTQWRAAGISPHAPYMNAGVLAIDTAAWRQRDLGSLIIDAAFRYRDSIRVADQDGFNIALAGEFARLPARWNAGTSLRRPAPHFGYALFGEDEIDSAVEDPAIIHFWGGQKPWHWGCPDSAASSWLDLVSRTAFRGFRLPSRPMKQILVAAGRRVLRV